MKLILNSFFVCVFFLCYPAFAAKIDKEYIVKVSGIKIGKINWKINMNEAVYSNEISLKSEGWLSSIYSFEGYYKSEGIIKENKMSPTNYSHNWKTNKVNKKMNLVFKNNKLFSLRQKPEEKESLRINLYDIKNAKDPLTSFLQIILGEKKSLVLDGRRTYTMNAVVDKESKSVIVEISNYLNLWADHKRNKFEKLTFEQGSLGSLPPKISIYFDGRVFRLAEN